MASALTIKSGGTWAVKSGATMAIKDAGLPPYVIEGLEQSHWMAENAVVSTGIPTVLSVPDVYGSGITMVRVNVNYPQEYSWNAWQLNGKTLPAMIRGGNPQGYSANGWTSKLNGYGGAFTVFSLMEFDAASDDTRETFRITGDTGRHFGFTRTQFGVNKIIRHSGGNIEVRQSTAISGKKIICEEYTGINAATALAQFRLWVDGVERSLTQYYVSGATTYGRAALAGTDLFYVAGQFSGWDAKWCHTHIYKGSLTDDQRNQVTNYLKSISGIV